MPLPAPRKLPWALKPLSSADTALRYDRRGRMVMTITHQLLAGLTPEMVAWWFRNIGGEMEVDGRFLNRYLVWHPHDHIRWELANSLPDGRIGVGSRFRIVEAFGADPRFYLDIIDTVIRLDAGGITLVNRDIAGIEITRLNHDFIATEGGTLYRSTLTVGIGLPLLCRLVNPLIHRFVFPEAMGRAWLRHNVEEVGLLEHIIPRLYPA
ncbi:MAG: hypothetical protein WDZ83_06680 [Rhizobiaceae bacterium]